MALTCLLKIQVSGDPAIGSPPVFAVLSRVSTSSSINRTETALSSAGFFIKAGCRPGPTSSTLRVVSQFEFRTCSQPKRGANHGSLPRTIDWSSGLINTQQNKTTKTINNASSSGFPVEIIGPGMAPIFPEALRFAKARNLFAAPYETLPGLGLPLPFTESRSACVSAGSTATLGGRCSSGSRHEVTPLHPARPLAG